MKYEVRAVLFFEEEDEARDFFHDCRTALAKAIVINPCAPNQECSRADLIHCVHDEPRHGDCDLAQHIDNCPECPPPGDPPPPD